VIVIACGLGLFVSSQQAAVEKSLLNSEHVKAQNVMLGLKNDEIAAAKKQLESDEDEWVLLSLGGYLPFHANHIASPWLHCSKTLHSRWDPSPCVADRKPALKV